MAYFVRIFLAVFIAPSLVIVNANPLPDVQSNDVSNSTNSQCITMTEARAQEIRQIIQEITDFIDNLAVKHDYFDVNLLKLDIGKYIGDSTTSLDLIVDDCQKPSAYDFSGDFTADSDDNGDNPDRHTTATPVKRKYKVTHTSRNTTQTDQQTQDTYALALDKTNNLYVNNIDATTTASNDYASHTDNYYETTDVTPTTEVTFVNNDDQTNDIGTEQHDSLTKTDTQTTYQQITKAQQHAENQRYDKQSQQYDNNQHHAEQIQKYNGHNQQDPGTSQQTTATAQKITNTDNQQYSNFLDQGNTVNQQHIENNQQENRQYINVEQNTIISKQNTINSQQDTTYSQQNTINSLRKTETDLQLTNVQQLKTDTVNEQTEQVQQNRETSVVTNVQQSSRNKQQVDNTQQFQENSQLISETDSEYLSQADVIDISNEEKDQNTYSISKINSDEVGSSENYQNIGHDNNRQLNNNINNELSQNPRYRIETLLLQSLRELIRIEIQESAQALNYQNKGFIYDRTYGNYGGENINSESTNYGQGNVNYKAENANFSGDNAKYGQNVYYEKENFNLQNINSRYRALTNDENGVESYGNGKQDFSEPIIKYIKFIPNSILEKKFKDADGGPVLVHIAEFPKYEQVTIL